MKTTIKPYTKSLLNQNLPYIAISLFFVVLACIGPFFMVNKINDNEDKEKKLESDIDTLKTKKVLLDTLSNQSSNTLTQNLLILNTLIPDSEDYFSIIDTLEKLSGLTNFHIISYTINISAINASSEKLPIEIVGLGDTQAFISFLNKYNFGGNRLITLDKVEFKPSTGESTYRLNMNFYHSKSTQSQKITTTLDYQKSFEKLEKFKKQINIQIPQGISQSNQLDTSYPTKSNPF